MTLAETARKAREAGTTYGKYLDMIEHEYTDAVFDGIVVPRVRRDSAGRIVWTPHLRKYCEACWAHGMTPQEAFDQLMAAQKESAARG